MVSATNFPVPNHPKPVTRSPVTPFPPSPWGDRFLRYTSDPKIIEGQQEILKALKEEIKLEILSVVHKPLLVQLLLIDSIERLDVAYHFKEEIEDALQRIHEMLTHTPSTDLFLTSLYFRLLRQHGFNIPSDILKPFISSNGALKEEFSGDLQGMLSLYEACYVGVNGEDILDEVLPSTISKLKSIHSEVNNPSLKEQISHALKNGLHRRVSHFECVRYMRVYEENELHNKTLLKFAKVDYNLLQASHKEELSESCRWWRELDVAASKLPIRERIVESHFWAVAFYSEPQYSLARRIAAKGSQLLTAVDDIYDSYATLEELEILTVAIDRWDNSCLDQLPEELRWFFQTMILDAHVEIERQLAPVGRSQYVHYAKEEMKALSKAYLIEARWRSKKYVPTLAEFKENEMFRSIAYVAAAAYTLLGMDNVTERDFEWLSSIPKPVKSLSYLIRIHDDIGGKEFDENKGDWVLFIECYMKEHGVSYEEARERLYEEAEKLWKDVNESIVWPTEVAKCVGDRVMNMARVIEILYADGDDGYTQVNEHVQELINTYYMDSIPV